MYSVNIEDLSDKTYSAIKEMILTGRLMPGEKLYQEKLASDLGISRTPLNSALNRLEKEMLVEALPRRGFYVKKLKLKELVDLYDVRVRLEPLAAREAINCKNEALFVACEKLLKTYEKLSEKGKPEDFNKIDYNFHNLITEMCGNIFLQRMIASFNIISLGNMQIFMKDNQFPKKSSDSINEHKRILAAIIRKDPDAAELEMHFHINTTRNILAEQLAKVQNEKA